MIQNFFSLSSSTYPARHPFLPERRRKKGSSTTDRQWELIHLHFLSSFFKNWQKCANAVGSQHFHSLRLRRDLLSLVQKRRKESLARKTFGSNPNHCIFERTLSINRQCSSSPFLQVQNLGTSQTELLLGICSALSVSLKHSLLSGLHTDPVPKHCHCFLSSQCKIGAKHSRGSWTFPENITPAYTKQITPFQWNPFLTSLGTYSAFSWPHLD